MPQAESTAATRGTTTRPISRRRATSVTCSPAAPPKARSVNRRGSTPRRTETMRMPSAMMVLTTRWMPSAAAIRSCRARSAIASTARCAAPASSRGAAAEEVPRIEIAEDEVGVGDGRRRAALAVARRARVGARALRSDVQDAARRHARDRAAARRPAYRMSRLGSATFWPATARSAGELRLAVLDERDVGARAAHVEGDQVALAEEPRAVAARPPRRPPGPDRTAPAASRTARRSARRRRGTA